MKTPSRSRNSRRKKHRKPRKAPVRIFRVTASSYSYNEKTSQLSEIEMYFSLAKRAATLFDIKRIRTKLSKKVCRHYRSWVLRHLNVRVGTVHVNFEPEFRARKQVEQAYASVDRFVLRRVRGKWEAQQLESGKMQFPTKRRR
jgi:hypothetical protein